MRTLVLSAVALTLLAAPAATRLASAGTAPARSARSATPADTNQLDDATIVAIFDAANTADMETGELAAKQGHSKEVRDLGAQFTRDHGAVRQQGRDLAKKLGVTPTPPKDDASAKDHAKAMATLRSKHGADFDRAYLAHEVAYHQAVIDAVNKTLLPAIQNAELKAFVVKIAPAFQAHLLAAQNLQKKLAN